MMIRKSDCCMIVLQYALPHPPWNSEHNEFSNPPVKHPTIWCALRQQHLKGLCDEFVKHGSRTNEHELKTWGKCWSNGMYACHSKQCQNRSLSGQAMIGFCSDRSQTWCVEIFVGSFHYRVVVSRLFFPCPRSRRLQGVLSPFRNVHEARNKKRNLVCARRNKPTW